jgi:hypothetical protein
MLDNISQARIISGSRPGATRSRSLKSVQGELRLLMSFFENGPAELFALGVEWAIEKGPLPTESCKQWKLEFEIPWKEQRYEL